MIEKVTNEKVMGEKSLPILLIIAFSAFLSVEDKVAFFIEAVILIFMATMSIIKLKQLYRMKKINLTVFRLVPPLIIIMALIIIYLLYNRYYL